MQEGDDGSGKDRGWMKVTDFKKELCFQTTDELICCLWVVQCSLCAAISIVLPKILMSTLPQS